MTNRRNSDICLLLLTAVTCGGVTQVLAQTVPEQASTAIESEAVKQDDTTPAAAAAKARARARATQLGTVTVTAERQGAVDIQKAPIAISVVNTQDLDRQGASGFRDYLTGLPSVALEETGPGQNKFAIRGMSAGSFNQTDTQDRTLVSVYLDDTPISVQGNTPDLDVFDLERVEVVRGPQGTLYGAGAMAGNIRLITVKPDLDEFSGTASTLLSHSINGGLSNAQRAVVNVPLVNDELALRASVYRRDETGYIDNLGTDKDHANGNKETQARLALRYKPSENFTFDQSLTYSRLRTDGLSTTLTDLGFNFNSNIPEGYHDRLLIYNATLNADLGFADLSSSTSYIDRSFGLLYSWQYALHRYVYKNYTDAQTQGIIAPDDIDNKLRDFTQEVKINSKGDGPLHWVGGVYFENQHRDYTQNIINPGLDSFLGPGYGAQELGAPVANDAYYGIQNVKEKQYAVFGELKYNLTDTVTGTLGARYFHWTQDFNLYQAGYLGVIYPANAPPHPLLSSGHTEENGVTPRVSLSWQATPNTMIFGEAAKGFRYGGVNYPLPNTCLMQGPPTFGSDSLWSYQVGEKSQFMDNKLKLNVTGFLINWSNVQTRRIDTSCSYFYLVAQGKIQSRGLELETSAKLTPALTLTLNASYTNAKTVGAIPGVSVSGGPAPNSPRYIGSAALDYRVPLSPGRGVDFNLSWRYRGAEPGDFSPVTSGYTSLPAFRQLNFAINYNWKNYEIGVFGRNILNEKEILDTGSNYRKPPKIINYGGTILYGRTATFGVRAQVYF